MTRLDHRSPLVLDTHDLQRTPGAMHEVRREVGAPADLGTDVISVPVGSPIELDLRLESVVEGVLLSGSARTIATGACVRCLEPATYPVSVRIQELFAYSDRATHHREVNAELEDDEDDVRELQGDLIDLEPVIRDTVVPALPFQPVCRVDCPGLCSDCGALLRDDPDHHHDVLDPRWASLGGLLSSPQDVPSNANPEKRT